MFCYALFFSIIILFLHHYIPLFYTIVLPRRPPQTGGDGGAHTASSLCAAGPGVCVAVFCSFAHGSWFCPVSWVWLAGQLIHGFPSVFISQTPVCIYITNPVQFACLTLIVQQTCIIWLYFRSHLVSQKKHRIWFHRPPSPYGSGAVDTVWYRWVVTY